MERTASIFVAGHRGLAGSAVVRNLQSGGFTRVVTKSHEELDLTDRSAVWRFFREEVPEYVFLAAAKVGGILANINHPRDFILENLKIETNVIEACHAFGASRLLFLGSSCIYPKLCPQPIKEEYLLTGSLEATNRAYAVAKIAGVELCWAYNKQLKTKYFCVMPTNLYGLNDNYDLETSHVIPALLRKMHEARLSGAAEVVLWGTGTPRREFLYSDDLANACVLLMNLSDECLETTVLSGSEPPIINVGAGEDLTIADLAALIAEVVDYDGSLRFDPAKPDGTPRKVLDVSRIRSLNWKPTISLRDGLTRVYDNFLSSLDTQRREHSLA